MDDFDLSDMVRFFTSEKVKRKDKRLRVLMFDEEGIHEAKEEDDESEEA